MWMNVHDSKFSPSKVCFAFFPDALKEPENCVAGQGKGFVRTWSMLLGGDKHGSKTKLVTLPLACDGLFNVSFHICKRGNNSIYFSG